MNIIVIGAGGTGSWLVPQLIKLGHAITLWDGDIYEKSNIDRQLFDESHIGLNKAEAMAKLYGRQVTPMPRWFHSDALGVENITEDDFIFCCADNHRARREALELVDRVGATAVIMGNGYTDSDAYIYKRDWRATKCDPRVRYPEILTDTTGDPMARAAGCTGDAQKETPQLVLANSRSADDGLHLFWFYTKELEKMKKFETKYLPVENGSSMFERFTRTHGQIMETA